MREIKFRGKSTASYEGIVVVSEGDWVYGNLIIDGGQAYIVNGVVDSNEEYISIEDWCPVDTNTVGEYTGLKDKNGVEIYDGDVVKCSHYKGVLSLAKDQPDLQATGVVEYRPGAFVVGDNLLCLFDGVAIIGNIYENPELLEETS